MALWNRSKKDASPAEQNAADPALEPAAEEASLKGQAASEDSAQESGLHGPWDASERSADESYLDFGALKLLPVEGSSVRVDVDPTSESIVAVTVEIDGSTMQLQAFAAPKSTGLWEDLRSEITESVLAQKGTCDEVPGPYGAELMAKIPQITPEGRPGYRSIRFIGIDRPRWFVRAVLSGQAAVTEEAAGPLTALLEDLIVERGSDPKPPRSLLALSIPDQTPANVAPASR